PSTVCTRSGQERSSSVQNPTEHTPRHKPWVYVLHFSSARTGTYCAEPYRSPMSPGQAWTDGGGNVTLTQAVETDPNLPEDSARSTPQAMPLDVRRRVSALARTSRLLVACDYDGTLAPIDSADRRPLSPAVRALRELAELPGTVCTVISSRPDRKSVV